MQTNNSTEKSFFTYVDSLQKMLKKVEITDRDGLEYSVNQGLNLLLEQTKELQKQKGKIFFSGNGASAMMASHMALDFTKNGKIVSQSFNDSAFLTAISNDLEYEQVFSLPLESYASDRDLFVAISSSGQSKNIIYALEKSREIGIKTITFTGKSEENKSRRLGDLNFYVREDSYGLIESSHQVLLHFWLDQFMINLWR